MKSSQVHISMSTDKLLYTLVIIFQVNNTAHHEDFHLIRDNPVVQDAANTDFPDYGKISIA